MWPFHFNDSTLTLTVRLSVTKNWFYSLLSRWWTLTDFNVSIWSLVVSRQLYLPKCTNLVSIQEASCVISSSSHSHKLIICFSKCHFYKLRIALRQGEVKVLDQARCENFHRYSLCPFFTNFGAYHQRTTKVLTNYSSHRLLASLSESQKFAFSSACCVWFA